MMADFGTLQEPFTIEIGPLLDEFEMAVSAVSHYGTLEAPNDAAGGEEIGSSPVVGQLYPS